MNKIIFKEKGVKEITRQESLILEAPAATLSYCPISNKEVIYTALEELDKNGFTIKSEFHKTDSSKNKFVGAFIVSGGNKEMDVMFGYKNSYDKSMSAAFAMGANIMICSNSVVTGEVAMIRKHTGTASTDLKLGIREGVKRLGDNFISIEKQLEEMKSKEITKRIQSELIGRLFLEEETITSQQLSIIKKELKIESFNYGIKDSMYNLYQAVTHSMKVSHPRTYLKDHIDAHSFFVEASGMVSKKQENSLPVINQLELFQV